jgi:hypothetical protein
MKGQVVEGIRRIHVTPLNTAYVIPKPTEEHKTSFKNTIQFKGISGRNNTTDARKSRKSIHQHQAPKPKVVGRKDPPSNKAKDL